ncbi:MAG: inositol monophosphatase [Verrucomicrobia bacterium]|nr:inositol monophosphatase [Verrucomicrobiota bacterium]
MPTASPSELTFVAIQSAMQAGALLRSGFGTDFKIDSKEGKQNLVTEYDKSSEACIISTILRHFPDHAILAEESGETQNGKSSVIWIIDPLDGTVNFAHGLPVFSVSIAAAIDGTVVSGVVYQPMTQELFTAEKGKGAYLNGKQIFVSKVDSFESSLMSTGFPYNVDKDPLHCVEKFAQMQLKGVPIRRLGSAAIDMSYVAAGRCDAFWEVGLHPWDMAAGKLLVEEAGGKVSHWDGSPHKIFGYETMLATNGLLHKSMLEHLK